MAPKKVKAAGRAASVPEEAPAPVQPAKKKASTSKKKSAPASTTRYIRNLHYAAGGVRVYLTDHKIKLEPRGQVGDLAVVSEEAREDPIYKRNINTLFEEISEAEAASVIEKQNINAQAPRSGPMQHIRNELGEEYQGGPIIEEAFEDQGTVVGQVSTSPEGASSAQSGNIERQGLEPALVQRPGSQPLPGVMPEGLTEQQAIQYLQTPQRERADFLARLRGVGEAGASAAAGNFRDSLNVTVGPTQREA